MDTAGKAVLFSGADGADLALGGDARPQPGLPLGGARNHGLGPLRPRGDADPAAGGARQARAAGRQARRCPGPTAASTARRASPRWGELLWRRPLLFGGLALVALVGLALPVLGLRDRDAVDQGRARGRPARGSATTQIQRRLRPGRAGHAAGRRARAPRREAAAAAAAPIPGSPRSLPAPAPAPAALALIAGRPGHRPVDPGARRRRSTACAATLPAGALVGGAAAENHDLESALAAKTPLVIGVVLGARLPAAAGRLPGAADRGDRGRSPTCSRPAAAFGVAKLIFQDGHLSGLLGFESQGFLDAWGPVFFFAMIFAIAMDYTVFLLSSAREHWERVRRRAGRRWSAASPTPAG